MKTISKYLFMQPGIFSSTLLVLCLTASMVFLSQCSRSAEKSDPQQASASDAPELAEYMTQLQYYTHKLALSVEANNEAAAGFYFHEITALKDNIQKDVPEYEGYNIAQLLDAYLNPKVEAVEEAISAQNWQEARTRLISLTDACNTCHQATDHGFIQVTPGFDKNPYNQVFKTR